MTFIQKLSAVVDKNDSLLCIGLDVDLDKIPATLKNEGTPLFVFNKAIIDATHDLVCAYKPNSAFYEAYGPEGIEQLKQTADYIHQNHPNIPIILDAKRGDIGNTNNGYTSSIFDYLGMDAVTLHPYFGRESLQPFLDREDKGIIILCRSSNPGAGEFQDLITDGKPVYQHVAKEVVEKWNDKNNCLLMVGATYPEEMKIVRKIAGPEMAFLVPGIGAQGGDIGAAVKAGIGANKKGLIINSARDIIYASGGDDFAEAARNRATEVRDEINKYRK